MCVLVFCCLAPLFADDAKMKDQVEYAAPPEASAPPATFFLIEGGWNTGTGIGLRLEHITAGRMALSGGLGLGSWGYKICAGSRYYFTPPFKASLGMDLYYNTGADSIAVSLDRLDTYGRTYQAMVPLRINPGLAANLSFRYDIRLSNSIKLGFEFGYGFFFTDPSYKILDNNDNLSNTSKLALKFTDPGGLVFGSSLGFGF